MTTAKAKRDAAEANRRRYEELRAAGQGEALDGLPAPTALGSLPIAASAIKQREEVPGGWYMTTRLRRGEMLRLIDTSGAATPTLVAWREADPSERINLADTVKVQWSATLRRGRIILSDMGRVVLSIVEDTSGAHDALMGGSVPASASPGSNEPYRRNTRENLVAATGKLGLDRRDIPPAVTFFAPVSIDDAGRFQWERGKKRPGDFVDLRAEMDLLVAISNCPHPLHPVAEDRWPAVEVIRHSGRTYAPKDPCRTATVEAVRAFEFTDRLAK
jgi:urea carboxylase-associated protein 2